MKEIFLIRHGESQYNTGNANCLDSALTETGMSQCIKTSIWLTSNIELEEFVGFTSPYLRTLQTASVISLISDVRFSVNDNIREFRFFQHEDVKIDNRSIMFSNLQWNKDWLVESKTFQFEEFDQIVDRAYVFLNSLEERHIDKAIVVSHGIPIVVIEKLLTGYTRRKIMQEVEEATKEFKNEYYKSIWNCGISYVKDGKSLWKSKTVF